MAKNSHHNVPKPFGRGVMPKGRLIDAISVEMGMLLERIDKMAEVQNLLLDWLHIHNGSKGLASVALQEALTCAHCSRLDHVEVDCLVMAIQGQNMYRQSPQGRSNYPSAYPNYYNNNPIFYNNVSQDARLWRNTDQAYPPS